MTTAFEGVPQPTAYLANDRLPTHLNEVLKVYGVTPTDNPLMDLTETGLLFRADSPGTDDEVLELTSGRYDGLRFAGLTGTLLKAKPITPAGP